MRFRGHDGRIAAERCGVLSKHRSVAEEFLPPRHGVFGAWLLRPDVNGQELQVANVHLEPVREPTTGEWINALDEFKVVETIHRREIEAIVERLAPEIPTLIVGDFNSFSWGQAPKYLIEHGFIDSYASVTEGADDHPTWRWPARAMKLAGRIDYIFHSRHFRTKESWVAPETTSDHYLLGSRLEWLSPAK